MKKKRNELLKHPVYLSVHLFLCLSIYLRTHCFRCNLDNLQSAFVFAHLRNVVFAIFTSQAKDSVCLFYHIYKGVTIFFFHKLVVSGSLTLGRTLKFIPPSWYKRGGGLGVDRTPLSSFWYAAVFRNDCTFSWKPLIFLRRWGILYGWWSCLTPVTSPTMVAILDFTKNWKSGQNCEK